MKKLTQQILSAHKDAGQKWLNELPSLIQNLAQQWQIEQIAPYKNLSWNYVAQGFRNGNPVVLKISYDFLALKREVTALKAFTSHSAVEVFEFDETNKAILLEAACPGKDLLTAENMSSFEILGICCDIAQKIKDFQKPNSVSFEPIIDSFTHLEKEWNLPEKLISTARQFRKELVSAESESAKTYLIHGDLHRGNILSHGDGWRVIDPKGYQGSIYNEIWPFIHEPSTEIPWVAMRLGLDADQLSKWCFIHSVVASTGCLQDGVDPKNILGLAEKLYPLFDINSIHSGPFLPTQ